MKSPFSKSLTNIMVCMVLSLFAVLYACKKPTEGISILIDSYSLFPAPTVIKFTNADSTSTNKLGSFTANITGPGAGFVQTSSGTKNFQVTNGMLELALTKDAHPSPSNPITFCITAAIDNFAPVVQNIVITSNKLSVYNVRALEYARPADGTSVVQANTGINQGTLPADYQLSTSNTATMNENSTIQVMAGTQLKDVNGNQISASDLHVKVVQFGTQKNASLQALPGGTISAGVTKTDGSLLAGNVNFVTAGLLQINMDAGGVPVKQFSQPISLTIQVSSKMTNFSTGLLVKAGDIVPYWSMNEQTGQWKNEGNTTLLADAGGKLYAVIHVSHLSCWSVGWSWGATGAYGTCGSNLTVIINTSDPNFKGGPYNVSLQTVDGTYLGGVQDITIANGDTVTLTGVPSTGQAKIVVSGGIPEVAVQSSQFDPCSAGTVSVMVPVSAGNTVNVAVDIVGNCASQSVTVLPSSTLELYQKNNGTYVDAGTIQLINGKGTAGMQVGTSYYLTTTYNGTFYKCDPFSVSKANMNIQSQGFNIIATYDPGTNTLLFKGSIPINCN